MEGFEERLIKEHEETQQRLIKLDNYIKFNADFNKLDEITQALLMRQVIVMTEYVDILKVRIDLLKGDKCTLNKMTQTV